MPKQNTVLWTGKVRLDVRNGRFVKDTNNRINSAENYAWYLDCKHSALGEIYSTKNCAFPIDAYWTFNFEEATRQPAGGRSRSCVKLDAPSISIQAKYNILPRTTTHIFAEQPFDGEAIVGTESRPKQSTAQVDVLVPLRIRVWYAVFLRLCRTHIYCNLQRFAGTSEWYVDF